MSSRATRQTRAARRAEQEPARTTRSGARIQPSRPARKREASFIFTDDSDAQSRDPLSQSTATTDEDERDELLAAAMLTPLAPNLYQARPAPPPRQLREQDISATLRASSVLRQARLSAPPARIPSRESSILSNLREARHNAVGPRKSAPQVVIRSNDAKNGFSDPDISNTRTNSRPAQRLRPSLSGPDGRLDIPTVQERCAVLSTVAKGVLHFYSNLDKGWKEGTFDEMVRNWVPFEAYKTNQLLDQGQYIHHFIDLSEVIRSLRLTGYHHLEGLEDALKMANCATFVHYVHQFHLDPVHYNKRNGKSVTYRDVFSANLRSFTELNDARRVFLSWIVPFDWPITDEVLNMLLDMSIQIFLHRLQIIVESLQAGQHDEDSALAAIDEELAETMNGEIVRTSLDRVKKQRNMSRSDIERAAQRYETFCNVQQAALLEYSMLDDLDKIRRKFQFLQMARDLTSFVGNVVRDVDDGMYSKTLPDVIFRLQRESSIVSGSEASVPSEDDISVAHDSSPRRGPVESTPRAVLAQDVEPSQPFASQYEDWLNDMMRDTQTQRQETSPPESIRMPLRETINLSSTQRLNELENLLKGGTDDEADSYEDITVNQRNRKPGSASSRLPSSPPRSKTFSDRLSAAKPPSGRNLRPSHQQSVLSASEQSEESSALHTGNMPDSPTGAKASRMNFDANMRLVRKPTAATTAARMLDGRADAVRESRFDSQAEGDEDVFLDGPGKRVKNKGKGKEAAKRSKVRDQSEVADDNVSTRPGRTTRSMSADPAAPPLAAQTQAAPSKGKRSGKTTGAAPPAPLEAIEENFQPDTEDYMPDLSAPPHGKRQHAEADLVPEVAPRAKKAKDASGTGIGRGLPESAEARDIRLLSTASGRMMETRDDAEEAVPDPRVRQNRPSMPIAPAEIRGSRASPDDDEFVGDDDQEVQVRRAVRAEKQKAREKIRQQQQRLDKETSAALLETIGEPSNNVAKSAKRIVVNRNGYREEVLLSQDADNDTSVLGRPAPSQQTADGAPPSQPVRVGAYRTSDIYVTGHNQSGRNYWTDAEVKCLLAALHDHAKFKATQKNFQIYTTILNIHGVKGDEKLARWNNLQLKDKARNELIRMHREGEVIPYWKQHLFPGLFDKPRFQRYTKADIDNANANLDLVAQLQDARDAERAENQDELMTEIDPSSQLEAAPAAATPAPSQQRSNPLRNSP